MKKLIITSLAAAAAMMAAAAPVTPLWMRDARVSPDGSTIAFRYAGDIFTVVAAGGHATRLTAMPSMERTPVWSPDGSKIAFASDRDGAFNIYVMDANGGKATRLTSGSTALTPQAFTPDGQAVVFSAYIQHPADSRVFPTRSMPQLYSVPVSGGRYVQILGTPAELISWLPDGKSFIYQDKKGGENEWRKHHTSSITRDIWRYDAPTGTHTNLTAHAGEDRNPVLSPDGSTLYFLSERDGGSMNVYSVPLDNPQQLTAVTRFKEHPVRFLSMGRDGKLVYTYDGELYTQAPGGQPSRVAVSITDDLTELPAKERLAHFTDGAVAPSGKEVALVSRGQVAVTSVDYPTSRIVTTTPGMERDLSWHPKDKKLAYASDRSGRWDIYVAEVTGEGDPDFVNATIISEKPLLPADTLDRTNPRFSPDGNQLAFLLGRDKIAVTDLKSGKVRVLTDGSAVTDRTSDERFLWSPDSKWLLTTVTDKAHNGYPDIAIINVATGEVTNLTGSGYDDGMPRWAMGGNAITFITERYGMRNHASWGSLNDVMAIFLNQEALDRFRLSKEDYELLAEAEKAKKEVTVTPDKDKKKKGSKKDAKQDSKDAEAVKPIVVELDGITDRIVRLTPNSSDLADAIITGDDGEETLYYLSAFEDGYDLWKRDLRKFDTPELVEKMGAGYSTFDPSTDGKALFILNSSGVKKLTLSNDKLKSVKISGTQQIDTPAEREAMYDYLVREERERFYEPSMHGVDWAALTDHYRRFLPHVTNNYDFAEMASELLGELNVSHTGSGYIPDGSDNPVADLGLLYDLTYAGPGMKVAEVVKKTPLATAKSRVRPGDILVSIGGTELSDSLTTDKLLAGMAGKRVRLGFRTPGGESYDEVVKPMRAGGSSGPLYQRWVERNRALVDSLSGGRLAYVHFQAMNDGSFRPVYSRLLGTDYDKEGVVIDTRFNGGGRMHEDIEVLFSGKHYFDQVVRGKEVGEMPSRRWNKPSIMLVCEANYSNAHGTPWVYQHTGIGKIVGAPVPGTMTSVNWVDLQDPSLYFGIPVIGMRQLNGKYLENQQLEPDVPVLNDPAEVVRGRDAQIEAAVAELLKDIDASKSTK
ncbi:MAG: S41 family peptidase [Candidatus Amulumruptor caecigallinarius]|nr:S41 family peptidase [Candidatus Amulumruptor caecigallinarius]MCM1397094.1 S41 family peptidase [Candidatus Amulumruptor caecigallinarius]MCM1454080.1 S41 family peptidase [bacterium]